MALTTYTAGEVLTALSLNDNFTFAAANGGKIIQVVSFNSATTVTTTSTSYVTTGLTVAITPTLATSKVMIIAGLSVATNATGVVPVCTIFRGTVAGTNLAITAASGWGRLYTAGGVIDGTYGLTYLDSPTTTSATTYTIGFKVGANSAYAQGNTGMGVITLMEVSA